MRSPLPHVRTRAGHVATSLLLLGLTLAPAARAQSVASTAPRAFSLDDAASLARRNHPLLSAAGGRRRAVTGAARQEAALPNPTLEWRKENLNSPLQRDEFVTAALPVDLYGRRLALRSASSAAAQRATSDSSGTARQVEFDVARAYWRAALAVALHGAAVSQRQAVDTIARIEGDRARQGAVPEGAALRARLEADRARLAEASARAEMTRAHGDLARALAMPTDSVPLPTDPVAPGTAIPVGARSVADPHALITFAKSHRPELQSARSRLEEVNRRQLAERLGTFPALGVQVGTKRTSGYQTGTVAVGIAVPLFDRNGGSRQRARGDVLVAEGELRSIEMAIEADVTSALRAYELLAREYAATAAATTAGGDFDARGRTVADIAVAAWREGAIALFELLDAERLHGDVRSAALRAAADVRLARLDLARALGIAATDPLPTETAR
ncbi:MAG: TolC family protein [Gemmatimonadaceae bacterium]|nr:TolC family protein [Gemmatimonadaceae bacterium]